MAQNVTIAGASYSDVPAIDLPKAGGGTARFMDTGDADAIAADIAMGKTAYVGGVKVTGALRPVYTLNDAGGYTVTIGRAE